MAVGLSVKLTQHIQSSQSADSPTLRSAFAQKSQQNELDEQSKAKQDCIAVNPKEVSIHVAPVESTPATQGLCFAPR